MIKLGFMSFLRIRKLIGDLEGNRANHAHTI
jgi:hypothetical protein